MLAKSLSSEEIAQEVISVLSVTYSVAPNYLLAAMRDRASTNTVAMKTMEVLYPDLVETAATPIHLMELESSLMFLLSLNL